MSLDWMGNKINGCEQEIKTDDGCYVTLWTPAGIKRNSF